MTEQERILRELIEEKRNNLNAAIKANDLDLGETIQKELETEVRKLKLMTSSTLEVPAAKAVTVTTTKTEDRALVDMNEDELESKYTKVFLKAVRKRPLDSNDLDVFEKIKELRDVPNATPYLKSDSDADGGLIIPKDVQTRINEYKRQFSFELQSLVSVERTAMLSGTRVFEKLADSIPWPKINQWETIPEVDAPQFEPKNYKIEDYGGILPIPRTMLQDTDQALMNVIAKHIARKTIITRNAEILNTLNTLYSAKKEVTTIDDFKDILNVEIDPAFAAVAKIVTNQTGYNILDKMKDETGNYLLQPDVTSPTGKSLLGKQVVLVPNRDLPDDEEKAPIYIGAMTDAVVLFDRGVYEITGTDVGGDSFKRNSYDIRVIDRFDVQAWDKEAVVAVTITEPVTP